MGITDAIFFLVQLDILLMFSSNGVSPCLKKCDEKVRFLVFFTRFTKHYFGSHSQKLYTIF